MQHPLHGPLAAFLLLTLVSSCRPPDAKEVVAETEEMFAAGEHKTALKKLTIFMRRNPDIMILRTKRLDYVARAGGIGAVLADRTSESVNAGVKPSKDGYKGALVRWIEKGLEDERPEVRAAAIEALGDMKRTGGIEPLRKMLAAGGHERASAIHALSRIQSGEAWTLLAGELGKPDIPPTMFVTWDRRRKPNSQLKEALESKDAAIRAGALLALAEVGASAGAMPAMREALADKVGAVRGAAARALGAMRDGESREQIERIATDDTDPEARAGAAGALGQIFDGKSLPALWKAFTDKAAHPKVRAEAAFSLSGFRSAPDDDASVLRLSSGQVSAVRRARRNSSLASEIDLLTLAAGELGDRGSIAGLKKALLSPDGRTRTAAAKLLWQFEDKSVDAYLGDALRATADPEAARAILRGITSWQSQEMAPLMAEMILAKEVPKALRREAISTTMDLGYEGRKKIADLFMSQATPEWIRAAALDNLRDKLDPKNSDNSELLSTALKACTNLVHSGPAAMRPAAMRTVRALGDDGMLQSVERSVLEGDAKPRKITDTAKGDVTGEHNPLLIHQIAAIATWL